MPTDQERILKNLDKKLNTLLLDSITALLEEKEQEKSSTEPKMIQISDRAYSVSETLITRAQYKRFCDATSTTYPLNLTETRYPITNVSWHDATNYCVWLSKKTNKHYRLLTEDEWEHCCGTHKEATPEIAVYAQNSIQHVATKAPNNYGLYDMLGCVWEWTDSIYKQGSTFRVVRGGSWNAYQDNARADSRNNFHPLSRNDYLGFRVLCEPTSE